MRSCRLALPVLSVSAVLLGAAIPAQAQSLVAKQLAGPPEEFAAMRAPDPTEATVFSKSALLPVRLGAAKSGPSRWQAQLPVENGRLRFLVFSGDADWQIEMSAPSGASKQAKHLARDVRKSAFGIEQASHLADQYTFDSLERGSWTLTISGDANAREGFVLIEGDAATELASHQTHRRQQVGESIGFTAMLTEGRIDSASLQVTAPDGTVSAFPMSFQGDGRYLGEFHADVAGRYLAQVVVRGFDRDGQPLVRTAEHVVPVVKSSLRLTAASAKVQRSGDGRFGIDIPVAAATPDAHYRALAEVWGTGANGEPVPVAWVGGMVTPLPAELESGEGLARVPFDRTEGRIGGTDRSASVIRIGLDERWVMRSGAAAPFELRGLRVEDPDHFVAIASADRLALLLPEIGAKAAPGEIAIDEAMTMGPRPAEKAAKGVGTRLLLVHGYCSGSAPWPPSHFTNASTFLDLGQSRSHDAFARLIQSFGSPWNSFGTVAHSQGGAASLHLYTYYWSGLDNATGSRLMQSVGTPYKGTNLAGILAALGSWFGVGCGTNDNLTYSGASAWLAGIPSWARAKVNYYTTSFRSTNWWTNDYCNFATDLVLSDPEDGTTEQANGQLSSAVNRGHTTGQCHTTGMRDPAQYLDGSRNSTMNSNAAR